MLKRRWLVLTIITFSFFLLFVLVSCIGQRPTTFTAPTNNFAATSTLNSEPLPVFTPIVTATPIKSNKQDLELALAEYLNLSNTCKKVDKMRTSDPNIVFSETKQAIDFSTDFVSEVAKSINNQYSAYILQSYGLWIGSSSTIPIYCEFCSKVYLVIIKMGKHMKSVGAYFLLVFQ